MEDMNKELSWDDEISKEGGEFTLLPEGDYNFVVESYERSRYNGSDKANGLPPCNMAVLKLHINATEGETTVSHRLYLHQRTEGLLSDFFLSIGQKKPGEPFRMNWNLVPGSTGRLKLGIRSYKNKDGEERQANEVKKFLPKGAKRFEAGRF